MGEFFASTEAEYVVVSKACTDIMFIKMIMEFLELEVESVEETKNI